MSTKIARVGGRALIVDESGRVLLIHESYDGGRHWLTPGGGVEGDEHPREAACREAMEEADIALSFGDADDEVLVTRRDWSAQGVWYDQVDHFFLARVPDGTPARTRALTDVERRTWLGFRWWSVAELLETRETIVPADLGVVLQRLLER